MRGCRRVERQRPFSVPTRNLGEAGARKNTCHRQRIRTDGQTDAARTVRSEGVCAPSGGRADLPLAGARRCPADIRTFHLEHGRVRHVLALFAGALFDPLLELLVRGHDHHGAPLKAGEVAHLAPLRRLVNVGLRGTTWVAL